jgi:dTMP kinase
MSDKQFIVFEGGEGAGKTSAIAALATTLKAAGHDVLLTREPGGTPEGLALRALLLAADAPPWDKHAELLLITAARIQHVKRIIEPALRAGKTVLCDRFIASTLAYQGAGRGIPTELILDLHRRLVSDIQPDLTILLDIDPAIGLARSARRLNATQLDEGRFEALDLAFHQKVRSAFLACAAATPSLIIDASQPLPEVQTAIATQVFKWLAA